jgi:type IV pilus biogenesis protein CpaD/CtpE
MLHGSIKTAVLLAVSASLCGCSQTQMVTAASACGSWQPITILKADQITDQTSAKILKNNEARKIVCKDKGAQHG